MQAPAGGLDPTPSPVEAPLGTSKILKILIKRALFDLGVLGAIHALRNRKTLTVTMFHRVIAETDERFPGAHPEYTLTPEEFEFCLTFFELHYNVVSLDDVFDALNSGKPLGRALLITFDDGWRDNRDYALPLLARAGLPATLFVATEFVGSRRAFWQEELYAAVVTGALTPSAIRSAAPSYALPEDLTGANLAQHVIAHAESLSGEERDRLIGELAARFPPTTRQMADASDLAELQDAGVCLGGHGHSHAPLTDLAAPSDELAQSVTVLKSLARGGSPHAMSLPHGKYDDRVIAAAHAAGFSLVFSSDRRLTPLSRLQSADPLGRIDISRRILRDSNGRLSPANLATWLFFQPHAHAN